MSVQRYNTLRVYSQRIKRREGPTELGLKTTVALNTCQWALKNGRELRLHKWEGGPKKPRDCGEKTDEQHASMARADRGDVAMDHTGERTFKRIKRPRRRAGQKNR